MAKKKRDGIHPVDAFVGEKIRARRAIMGLSQQDLGRALDLTYQQIQKYESGMNRVVSSRLYEMARVLRVSIPFFFEGLDSYVKAAAAAGMSDKEQAVFSGPQEDVMSKKETIDLLRAYYSIEDEKVRRQIIETAKAIGKS